MINKKEEFVNLGGISGNLASLILPEYYHATNIKDFLENRTEIKPTASFLPMGVFFRDYAIIELPKVKYIEIDKEKEWGRIIDLTNELTLILKRKFGWIGLKHHEVRALQNKMTLYQPWIAYNPERDLMFLERYETRGSKVADEETILESRFAHNLA